MAENTFYQSLALPDIFRSPSRLPPPRDQLLLYGYIFWQNANFMLRCQKLQIYLTKIKSTATDLET
jgi:hypothetical protein